MGETPSAEAKAKSTKRTTVYSDTEIEDFLYEIRLEAAKARMDLTDSAVWRWAMHDLMERLSPKEIIEHFKTAPPESGHIGRPRR